jgi:DNA-binding response OmpR family regulator
VEFPGGARRACRCILIVDDDTEIRELLKSVLEHDGWVVEIAADGIQALIVLARRLPDVMLLDMAMPGMSGWDVLDRHALESTWMRVPVLAMSADHHLGGAVLERGAIAFLPKPFTVRELRAALLEVLNS